VHDSKPHFGTKLDHQLCDECLVRRLTGLRYLNPVGDSDADRFRREAEECRQMAAQALHPVDKDAWLKLAADWLKLAEKAEKN